MLNIAHTFLQTGVRSSFLIQYKQPLHTIQQAGRKPWLFPKPRILANFDENGSIILPDKIPGYTEKDILQLKKVVQRHLLGVSADQRKSVAQRVLVSFSLA
jgi:hypothetical protein